MITWLYGLLHRKGEEPKPSVLKDCVLRRLFFTEDFGSTPQDYTTGWVWVCACGTHNQRRTSLASTEERALNEWEAHAAIRKRVKAGMHRG